jgi:phage-related minor tail protein
MIRSIAAALLALALAAPALADNVPSDLAESRLRGCLLAGASSADPVAGLEATIIRTRAYCGAQISRVRDQRVAAATAGLTGSDAKAARDRAIRALNDEIAHAIANFSGLTQ